MLDFFVEIVAIESNKIDNNQNFKNNSIDFSESEYLVRISEHYHINPISTIKYFDLLKESEYLTKENRGLYAKEFEQQLSTLIASEGNKKGWLTRLVDRFAPGTTNCTGYISLAVFDTALSATATVLTGGLSGFVPGAGSNPVDEVIHAYSLALEGC